MGTPAYRHAVVEDVPAVLRFWAVAAEESDRPPDTAEAIVALIRRDPEALLLACDGEDLVGSVIAGWDGWRCHLYRLAVLPARRREGIGRELVRRAEERFLARGGTRATAMVLDDNHLAHHAWRAAGYARQESWSRWVRPLP